MAALSFTPDWSGCPLPGLMFPEINQSEAGCIFRFSFGLISSTVSLGLVFSSVWLVLGHKILEFTAKEANMHVIFMSAMLGGHRKMGCHSGGVLPWHAQGLWVRSLQWWRGSTNHRYCCFPARTIDAFAIV